MSNNPHMRPCARCGIQRQVNETRHNNYCRSCANTVRQEMRTQHARGPQTWMESASCREIDPNIFYERELMLTGQYKLFCAPCPVQTQCLMFAHAKSETYGVWGGLTYVQRRYLVERGAGPTQATPGDVTRCRKCGAWKEAHLFCKTCITATMRKRMD